MEQNAGSPPLATTFRISPSLFRNPLFVKGRQLSPSFEEPPSDSPLSTPSPIGQVQRPDKNGNKTPSPMRSVQSRGVWLRENQLYDIASPEKTAGLKDTSTAFKELRNVETGSAAAVCKLPADQGDAIRAVSNAAASVHKLVRELQRTPSLLQPSTSTAHSMHDAQDLEVQIMDLQKRTKDLQESLAKEQELRSKLQLRLMGAHSTIKRLKDNTLGSMRDEEQQYKSMVKVHHSMLKDLEVSIQTAQQQLTIKKAQLAQEAVMDELESVRRQLLRSPGSSAGASPVSSAKASGNSGGQQEAPMSPKELCPSPTHAPAAVQQTRGQLFSRFQTAAQQSSCASSASAAGEQQQDSATSSEPAHTPPKVAAGSFQAVDSVPCPRTGPLGRKVKRILGMQDDGTDVTQEGTEEQQVQPRRPLLDKGLLPKLMAQLAADVAHPSARKPVPAVKDAQTVTDGGSSPAFTTPGSSVGSVGSAGRSRSMRMRQTAGGAMSPLQQLAVQMTADGELQQPSSVSPFVSLRNKYHSVSKCPSTQPSQPPSTGPPAASAPTPTEPQYAFERGGSSTLALLDAIEHWAEGQYMRIKQTMLQDVLVPVPGSAPVVEVTDMKLRVEGMSGCTPYEEDCTSSCLNVLVHEEEAVSSSPAVSSSADSQLSRSIHAEGCHPSPACVACAPTSTSHSPPLTPPLPVANLPTAAVSLSTQTEAAACVDTGVQVHLEMPCMHVACQTGNSLPTSPSAAGKTCPEQAHGPVVDLAQAINAMQTPPGPATGRMFGGILSSGGQSLFGSTQPGCSSRAKVACKPAAFGGSVVRQAPTWVPNAIVGRTPATVVSSASSGLTTPVVITAAHTPNDSPTTPIPRNTQDELPAADLSTRAAAVAEVPSFVIRMQQHVDVRADTEASGTSVWSELASELAEGRLGDMPSTPATCGGTSYTLSPVPSNAQSAMRARGEGTACDDHWGSHGGAETQVVATAAAAPTMSQTGSQESHGDLQSEPTMARMGQMGSTSPTAYITTSSSHSHHPTSHAAHTRSTVLPPAFRHYAPGVTMVQPGNITTSPAMTSKFGCIGQGVWVKPVQLTASDLADVADDVQQDSVRKAAPPSDKKRRSGNGTLWLFRRSIKGSLGAGSDQGITRLSDDSMHDAPKAPAPKLAKPPKGGSTRDGRERVGRARTLWQKLAG